MMSNNLYGRDDITFVPNIGYVVEFENQNIIFDNYVGAINFANCAAMFAVLSKTGIDNGYVKQFLDEFTASAMEIMATKLAA
jgi:hypothetical protein